MRRLIEGTGDDRRLVISFTGVLPGEGQQQGIQNDLGAGETGFQTVGSFLGSYQTR